MIWLTWRQYRLEALIGAAAFGLAAAVLLVTGLSMASDFEHTGVAACLVGEGQNLSCGGIERSFQTRFQSLARFVVFLYFLPLLIGQLPAAPFAQELEQGTYRLIWSQSMGANPLPGDAARYHDPFNDNWNWRTASPKNLTLCRALTHGR